MAKAPSYEGVTADMSVREGACIVLRALFEEAMRYAPEVLDGDTRAVHDMRVSIRRLRSGLRTFENAFEPAEVDRLRALAGDLGRKLGSVRDLDVQRAALRGELAGASEAERAGIQWVVDELAARRRAALAEFAIELSQFDREQFSAALSDA